MPAQPGGESFTLDGAGGDVEDEALLLIHRGDDLVTAH